MTVISARRLPARRVAVAQLLLTVLALLPFLLGFTAGQIVRAAAWTWAGAVVGWRAAHARNGGI